MAKARRPLMMRALVAIAVVGFAQAAQATTIAFKPGGACKILSSTRRELYDPKLPPGVVETLYTLLWLEERPEFYVVYERFTGFKGGPAVNAVSFLAKDGRTPQQVLRDVRTAINFATDAAPRDSWMRRPFDADPNLKMNRFTIPRPGAAKVRRALVQSGGIVEELQGDKVMLFARTERYWRVGGHDYLLIGGSLCGGDCPRHVSAIYELKPDFTVGPMLCMDIWRDRKSGR